MFVRSVLLAVIAMVVALPVVMGQRTVDACEQQCLPHDDDVNGPGIVDEGPVMVILYAHPDSMLGWMPMTNQLPDPALDKNLEQGFILPEFSPGTGTPVDDVSLAQPEFYFVPTKGLVEEGPDGYHRCICSHGLDPFELGPGPINLYGYVSADQGMGDYSTDAAVLGPVRVKAELFARMGKTDSVFATGASTPFTVQAFPGEDRMVEVLVPLNPTNASFVNCVGWCGVRVTVEQIDTGVATATQSDWRLRSGPEYLWRLVVPVLQSSTPPKATATFFDQNLTVQWWIAHAFSADSLDPSTLDLRIRDGDKILWAGPPTTVRDGNTHDDYGRPSLVRWVVPRSSLYDLTPTSRLDLSALTSQGTRRVTTSLGIPDDPAGHPQDLPGPEAAVSLLVVAIGFALARRR